MSRDLCLIIPINKFQFRIASGVIDGIIQKCFNSKPKTKEVATEICLQVSSIRTVRSNSVS